ncbi:MAG TPA: hypothetical protein VGB30_01435 [bacterium]|jgi:hypothetical protein
MYRLAIVAAIAAMLIGCGKSQPVTPAVPVGLISQSISSSPATTRLWGLYDVYIDLENESVEAVTNRTGMFTADINKFINISPVNLTLDINQITYDANYFDLDLNLKILHPFPVNPEYNGYDVRGVFMGDGSMALKYNPDLIFPVNGVDQMMIPNPESGYGGPDGYTRWYNFSEFSLGGMPLFNYIEGAKATVGFHGTSTLNPYKTFVDDLSPQEDLFTFLSATKKDCVFSSGKKCTRNYYLRFPYNKGLVFGYAVIANWAGVEPKDHPDHANEAVACRITDNCKSYLDSNSTYIVDLDFYVNIFDWDSELTSTVMDDYSIFLETPFFDSPYKLDDSEMSPVEHGNHFNAYHVVIPGFSLQSITSTDLWIVVERNGYDYTNTYGVENLAGTDPLAAYFRHGIDISFIENHPPVITGVTDDIAPDGFNQNVGPTDTSVEYTVFYEDPEPFQEHTIRWYIEDGDASVPSDPPDSMPVNWTSIAKGVYNMFVTVDDGDDVATGGPYKIYNNLTGYARTWGGVNQDRSYGIEVDDQGNIYICGNFYYTVDFDPSPQSDFRTATGTRNSFLTKFDTNGNHLWVRTWGGGISYGGGADSLHIDAEGNLLVAGWFYGNADFDPGDGIDEHDSVDDTGDSYVTKFTPDGDHIWAATWGGPDELEDRCLGIFTDSNSNIYAAGGFVGVVDFDPGPGIETRTSNGARDIHLLKLDSSGNYQWVVTWGGDGPDYALDVRVDSNDCIYLTGNYLYSCDFNPGPDVEKYDAASDGKAYVCKYSPDGDYLWTRVYGGSQGYGYCLAFDSLQNIYISGGWEGVAKFKPGEPQFWFAHGERDAYLNSFTPDGTWHGVLTWESIASLDTISGFTGHSVAIDDKDAIYLTGHFTQTADLDPTGGVAAFTSHGARDIYVIKLDSPTVFMWARTFGAGGDDDGSIISVDDGGFVYTAGWFQGKVDFYPGYKVDVHEDNGILDAFLLKLNHNGNWSDID